MGGTSGMASRGCGGKGAGRTRVACCITPRAISGKISGTISGTISGCAAGAIGTLGDGRTRDKIAGRTSVTVGAENSKGRDGSAISGDRGIESVRSICWLARENATKKKGARRISNAWRSSRE